MCPTLIELPHRIQYIRHILLSYCLSPTILTSKYGFIILIRRNILVIGGIEEKDNEQCEKLVRTFFKDKLKLDSNSVNHMRIVGCHRLGKQFGHKGHPRSIIIRFLDYNDRHIVWMAKKNINDKTLSINEHFCGDTEFRRRKLYPIYRAAKKKEKYRAKVSLIGDTLVLNNQRFYVETIGDLPDDLHPRTMCERSNKDTLVLVVCTQNSAHIATGKSLLSRSRRRNSYALNKDTCIIKL